MKVVPGDETEGGHAAETVGDQDQAILSGYLPVDCIILFIGLRAEGIR